MPHVAYFLEFIFLRMFAFLVNLLPLALARRGARKVGHLLYYLLPRYRHVAHENLTHAYAAQLSPSEIRRIAIQTFENLALLGVEFIRIAQMTRHLERYVTLEHEDRVTEVLKQGRGAVLIVSHFGNWEWMAAAAGARAKEEGVPIYAVGRPLKNPYVYRYIKKLRGATGLQSIDKKGAVRDVMKLLAANEVVCMLIDQHERQGAVRVPFFGREASTTTLAAMLAVKKGVPVLPAFCYRRLDAPSRAVVGTPFPLLRTGDYERDLYENTRQYVQAIEREVRKEPSAWLWMHRRWR